MSDRQPGPCILPFADCPYRTEPGQCDDLPDSPYNSDAGCFEIPKRKRQEMVIQACVVVQTTKSNLPKLCMWASQDAGCQHVRNRTGQCVETGCPVTIS